MCVLAVDMEGAIALATKEKKYRETMRAGKSDGR